MSSEQPDFAGPLEARLYRMAEIHCARGNIGLRAFGAAAMNDAEFVPDLTRRRSPTLATSDAMLAGIGAAPVRPFFETEVDAFLDETGTKRSVLGRGATNNPSLVTQIEDGMSPTLGTVHKVRSWMAKQTNPAHSRAIRRRVGSPPVLLADTPLRGPRPSSKECTRPPLAEFDDDDEAYIDTEEAAAFVGLAASTLARYRWTGCGPIFYRMTERLVRYRRHDLAVWDAERRRR